MAPSLLYWGEVYGVVWGWSATGSRGPGTRLLQALPDLPLVSPVAGLVVPPACEGVGEVLLLDERVGMVVRVLVGPAVPQPLHERRGRVPQVERDGQRAARADVFRSGHHPLVGGV